VAGDFSDAQIARRKDRSAVPNIGGSCSTPWPAVTDPDGRGREDTVPSQHPYSSASDRAFWARSVARAFDPSDLLGPGPPLISRSDRIVSAGGCFAANIVSSLEQGGFTYLRTEAMHPVFADLPEGRFGYSRYSTAFGNVYTARQLLQLLKRALGGEPSSIALSFRRSTTVSRRK
jgi:hypothetical protein